MSLKALTILITDKADKDEEAIFKYIHKKFGKQFAEVFRKKLIELFALLALTPYAGRKAKRNASLRVYAINRQSKLVYKVTETELVIIRILSTRTKLSAKY